MHRIEAPGATQDNRFTEGDPAAGTPATEVSAEWLNAVQDELIGVLTKAGIDPKTADTESADQVGNAIAKLITDRAATQDETDAGEDDSKFVTPLKLKNWVKQATETVAGMLKVATQTQVDSGEDDTTAVTPKKLRWGIAYSFGVNSYVAFPSWIGGLIMQFGYSEDSNDGKLISLPLAYPSAQLIGLAVDRATAATNSTAVGVDAADLTSIRVSNTSTAGMYWLSIGH